MPSANIDSTLGAMVANRQRRSSIRQTLRLEPKPGTLERAQRNMAPQPAADAKTGQNEAVEEEFDFDGYVLPPEKEQQMLERIQGWIDENGNGIDDRAEAQGQQESPSSTEPKRQVVSDERVTRALSPLAEFYSKNNKMPTAQDLQRMAASRTVKERLGRDPSDEEIDLYMTPPEKGMAMKKPGSQP